MSTQLHLIFWVTDKSTGQHLVIKRTVPHTDDIHSTLDKLMTAESTYEFTEWTFDEDYHH